MYAPADLVAPKARQQPVTATGEHAVNTSTLQSIGALAALRDGVSRSGPRSRVVPNEYLESAIDRA